MHRNRLVRSNIPIISLLISLLFLPLKSVFATESFAMTDVDGNKHSLESEKGKWVIINYWATWCPPCIKEIPELIIFHDKHKDKDAVVWGVNIEEIENVDLASFRKKLKMQYPIFVSPSKQYTYFEPLASLPITYIMSPDGNLFKKHIGKLTALDLEKIILQ